MAPLRRILVTSTTLAALALSGNPIGACERCRPQGATPPLPASTTPTAILLRDLDQRAAAAASAAPHLTFPSRIGIARIENGGVTPIPPAEWKIWRGVRDQMGATIGGLEPVSAIVAQSITQDPLSRTPHDAITNIRLGAARQQLDAVIVYEFSQDTSLENTELALLDATIVGAWWFPTHRAHAVAHATATLLDVRSGLAYGSAIGNASDARNSTLLGSQERNHRQRDQVARKAVEELAADTTRLLLGLARNPAAATQQTRAARRAESDTPLPPPQPAKAADDRVIPPPVESGDSFWGSR